MNPNTQKKVIAGNTVYTIGAGLLMNGVLQIIVYPLLNRHMGSEPLGNLLFIMGLTAIITPSIGQALNTSRLVVRRTEPVSNGDYNAMLLVYGSIGAVIALLIAAAMGQGTLGGIFGAAATFALILLMVFRYYGDVEFRLNLNYRNYFIYYAILTAGYLIGFGLYFVTGIWYLIFVTGEAMAILYLVLRGTIFKNFLKTSNAFRVAVTRGTFLIFSYVITNLTLNIDRLVLKMLIDDLAVTQYYVVSLIGKTMVLLVAPINTIIISYLTKRKENLDRKQYMMFVGGGLLVSLVFFLGAEIATPLFLMLFYGNLYESVCGLITIVNASQILGLLSAYIFIVVLTFTEEKWQMILQTIHLIIISLLVFFMTRGGDLHGFSIAVLMANTIRVITVITFGLFRVGKSRTDSGTPQRS